MASVLDISDLTVTFGGATALDGASLRVEDGEVHGLIGPNGAGKTTLLNAVTGFVRPAGGRLLLDGRPLPSRPHLVARAGVARTFQSVGSFVELSAIQNLLTLRGGRRGGLSERNGRGRKGATAAAHELLDLVEFTWSRHSAVENLPFAAHRKVEIARALFGRPRLLLMDEPTAGLEGSEVAQISELLRRIVTTGMCSSVVLIEHNVQFVFSTSDSVTALDQGRAISSGSPAQVRSHPDVIASYLGRSASLASDKTASDKTQRQVEHALAEGCGDTATEGGPASAHRLEVRGLVSGYGRTKVLKGIDLVVEPSETVLVYGRNGAGKSTLLNALTGQPRAAEGTVLLGGRRVSGLPVSGAVAAGIGLVPQGGGVLALQTVLENLQVGVTGLHLSRRESGQRRDRIFELFPALAERQGTVAGSLSGGQRQMLALGKVLMREPAVLLLDEPSIGLAPSVVDELGDILRTIAASRSVGILVAEQNIRWVAAMASRGIHLDGGAVVRIVGRDELQRPEELMASYLSENGTPSPTKETEHVQ